MMSLNGFDKIAWLYDSLARLVFGDRLMMAQTAFLHRIKPGSRVLILGGGTGAIVSELLAVQPDCHIAFVDASQAMIKRAHRRLGLPPNIIFVHGTEASIPAGHLYDIVITPFFLDMFPEEQLTLVIRQISRRLSPTAIWLVADFCCKETLWQRLQLAVMYVFFRLTTNIAARTLPDWDKALKENAWKKMDALRIEGFIEGAVYRL